MTATISTLRTTTSAAPTRRLSGWTRTRRQIAFETSMVFRQRNTLLATLLAPVFVLFFPIVSRPEDATGWTMLMAPMTVLVLVFSVYINGATIVAARRESQLFKRLRTSELTPTQLIVSMMVPLVLLGLVQVGIVVAGVAALGGPLPADPALVAAAALVTALLSVTAGVAVGSISPNSERVQYSVMPLLLLAAIGSNLVVAPNVDPGLRSYLLFAPFTGAVDLVARAGDSVPILADTPLPVSPIVFDLGITGFWIVALGFLAFVTWRWEPRG
ncbi:ABC transporter permease [Rhodococcoides corynebacterioides]|uniref:ABC transporter permease n=1 Tax=Rhodococcoides corynebacterioides TaxID=53972 RepID=UPI001C9AA9D1|nr:ABC transporter permease [Rhodococcus corynebacterioides]MBY6364766.1 ABC transporter permease [Rhodococcus corynebacterioides]